MALVRSIHLLADGNQTEARRIALDIQQHQRLYVGSTTTYGAGAYAWYEDCLPKNLQDWPRVLFEIDDDEIVNVCRRNGTPLGFFRIPSDIGSYISIGVVEFINVW